MARPGFAAVLDALALPDSVALVVPDLDHLSPDSLVREGLVRSVRRTGAKIIVAGEQAAVVDIPAVNGDGKLTDPDRPHLLHDAAAAYRCAGVFDQRGTADDGARQEVHGD